MSSRSFRLNLSVTRVCKNHRLSLPALGYCGRRSRRHVNNSSKRPCVHPAIIYSACPCEHTHVHTGILLFFIKTSKTISSGRMQFLFFTHVCLLRRKERRGSARVSGSRIIRTARGLSQGSTHYSNRDVIHCLLPYPLQNIYTGCDRTCEWIRRNFYRYK